MLLLTERSEQEGGFIVVHRGSIPPLSISHSLSVSLPISLFVSLSQSLYISLVDIIAVWGAEIKETPLFSATKEKDKWAAAVHFLTAPASLNYLSQKRPKRGKREEIWQSVCPSSPVSALVSCAWPENFFLFLIAFPCLCVCLFSSLISFQSDVAHQVSWIEVGFKAP